MFLGKASNSSAEDRVSAGAENGKTLKPFSLLVGVGTYLSGRGGIVTFLQLLSKVQFWHRGRAWTSHTHSLPISGIPMPVTDQLTTCSS